MRTRQTGPFASILISIVFIVAGWLVYKHVTSPLTEEAKASDTWPSVTGVVISSEISESYSDNTKMYSPDVFYEYSVNNEPYTGSRIKSLDGTTSSYSSVKKTLQKYQEGKNVSVYYNPEAPGISMLEPGAGFFTYLIKYAPLLFCLVGILILLKFLKLAGAVILALILSAAKK
jgi:hypothetical protein